MVWRGRGVLPAPLGTAHTPDPPTKRESPIVLIVMMYRKNLGGPLGPLARYCVGHPNRRHVCRQPLRRLLKK